VLIVGAGATGAGAALDAAQRGLKVACVEREDFGSGTSSRSTKLIWAGSRYLVMALVNLFHTDLRLLRKPRETISAFLEDFRMVHTCSLASFANSPNPYPHPILGFVSYTSDTIATTTFMLVSLRSKIATGSAPSC